MVDQGGSATLIFYRLDEWKKEHPLNILAAWATGSAFSHVELAIGEEPGNRGEMKNVVRVFNDAVGVVSFHLPPALCSPFHTHPLRRN
jgi:hypothetical protein